MRAGSTQQELLPQSEAAEMAMINHPLYSCFTHSTQFQVKHAPQFSHIARYTLI